jgi:hypothetical protein
MEFEQTAVVQRQTTETNLIFTPNEGILTLFAGLFIQ